MLPTMPKLNRKNVCWHNSKRWSKKRVAKDLRQKAGVAASDRMSIEQRIQAVSRMIDVAKQTQEGATSRVHAATTDIDGATTRIASLGQDDQRLMEELQALSEAQASLREKIETSRASAVEARQTLRAAEESVRGIRDEREAATTLRMDFERQIDQIKLEIAQIRSQLEERYQLSVTALLDRMERNGQILVSAPRSQATVDGCGRRRGGWGSEPLYNSKDLCIKPSMLENEELISEWVQRLTDAKRRLERVGEVNLVAVNEYPEVKDRYDTLNHNA